MLIRGTRKRGFTLPELLAVLCIVVLLGATFVPYAMSLRETSNRVRCAGNLGSIYWALAQYAKQNGYAYPRTRFDDRLGNRWTAFTGADDADPFAPASAVAPNDVSASLWLLVRTVDARPEWFVCPSSEGEADPMLDAGGRGVRAAQRGNFRGTQHLTYAVAAPFSAIGDYALSDTLPSGFVLVADQGPSVEMLAPGQVPAAGVPARSLAMGNSVNHRRAGQNVLFASGTVQFETTPYCGVGRVRDRERTLVDGDNIYTALAAAPLVDARPTHSLPGFAGTGVGPAYRYDTVLVPGADFKAAAIAPAATDGVKSRAATRAVESAAATATTATTNVTTAPATTQAP